MKQIYFATKNKGKVVSIGNVLSKYGIEVVHVPIDLPEPRSDELRTIAKEKVLFAHETIKKPCIALDAGFYIHSLNGFPKAFVNFALETIGLEGILKLVEGKPRGCEFRNCIAYFDGSLSEPLYFESENNGVLAEAQRGVPRDYLWSPLGTIFIPSGRVKTLAEMTREDYLAWRLERDKVSAIVKLAEWLAKNNIYLLFCAPSNSEASRQSHILASADRFWSAEMFSSLPSAEFILMQMSLFFSSESSSFRPARVSLVLLEIVLSSQSVINNSFTSVRSAMLAFS